MNGGLVRIVTLPLLLASGAFEALVRSGSADAVVSSIVVLFSAFRVAVDVPGVEWMLGWLVLLLGVLTFAETLYLPGDSAPAPWILTLAGGAIASGLVFEQLVGRLWATYPEPALTFPYASETVLVVVLLGPLALFALSLLIAVVAGETDPTGGYSVYGVVVRSWVICLSTGLLLALFVPLTPLPELVFIVSGLVLFPAALLGSDRSLEFVDERIMKSVAALWGESRDVVLWIYSFLLVIMVVLVVGRLRPLVRWSAVLRSSPVTFMFLSATIGSALVYVLFYVARLNQRAYVRISGGPNGRECPKRLAGLLLPVPVALFTVERAFPAADLSGTVGTENLALAAGTAAFVGLVAFEGVTGRSILPEFGIGSGAPWQDVHVVPIAVSNVSFLTVALWVRGSGTLSSDPVQAGVALVTWNFFVLAPYYGFYLLRYVVRGGQPRESRAGKTAEGIAVRYVLIEPKSPADARKKLRVLAAVWAIGGIALTVYMLALVFTPLTTADMETLGFALALWFVLLVIPLTLNPRMLVDPIGSVFSLRISPLSKILLFLVLLAVVVRTVLAPGTSMRESLVAVGILVVAVVFRLIRDRA
jgi:hypothetical protein